MGNASPEIALHNTIQSSVQSDSYPTIFGWHTKRDDELAFMLIAVRKWLTSGTIPFGWKFFLPCTCKPADLIAITGTTTRPYQNSTHKART